MNRKARVLSLLPYLFVLAVMWLPFAPTSNGAVDNTRRNPVPISPTPPGGGSALSDSSGCGDPPPSGGLDGDPDEYMNWVRHYIVIRRFLISL